MRAGKKERKKWAARVCGEKENGELAGPHRGNEMARKKRFGPRSDWRFEKSFHISRFRLKFEFEQVLHES
jgi:hypothetical protein